MLFNMRYDTTCPPGANYRMRVHPASGSGINQASWNALLQGSCQPSSSTSPPPDCLETGQSAPASSRDGTEAAAVLEEAGRERPEAIRLGPEATRIVAEALMHGTEAPRLTPEAVLEMNDATIFPPEAPGDRTEAVPGGTEALRKPPVHASGVSLTAARVAPAGWEVTPGGLRPAGAGNSQSQSGMVRNRINDQLG